MRSTTKRRRLAAKAEQLLALADIQVNGPNAWDMQVHDERAFARIFAEGSLGLGESYIDGWWDCEQLDEFVARCLRHRVYQRLPHGIGTWALYVQARFANRQTKRRAFKVGDVHYNLGNDLFEAMYDSRITASCGYWNGVDDLDAAQEAKLDLICRKIGLAPGQTVMDIGCGWGSFMGYAAEKYGARCTGVTVSEEGVAYIKKRYGHLPVEPQYMDYRDIAGTYDHVVSVGMFEHVGNKNYRAYFETAHRALKDDGFFLLHTIAGNQSANQIDPWMERHIFPNGVIPSLKQIGKAVEGLFVVEDAHNFGADYDKTLMAWFEKFDRNWPALREHYGDRFYRTWRYYLLICAGAFRARHLQLLQLVLSKSGVPGGYTPVR